MPMTRRIFNIFLASPNDVAEERAALQDVVNEINRVYGPKLAWQIELHKWEDVPPGSGRPQEIINKTVDACELFIGLLWKRWGEPTGNYSSGFEEEFERAKAQHAKDGSPEIWLFFKAVDPELRNDPGAQLTKVLKFQESQIELRDFLFHELRDAEQWKDRIREFLSKHVLGLALAANTSRAQTAVAVPLLASENVETNQSVHQADKSETSKQLAVVSTLLSQVVERGELEFSRSEENLLREFDVVRLFLLSATWMSNRYTGDVLEVHEMNLVYKHRGNLIPTVAEDLQLFRSVLADGNDVVPGWFWHSKISSETIEYLLIDRAVSDSNASVKSHSLQMLADAKITIPTDTWADLPVDDGSVDVRSKAYNYMVVMGDETTLPFLEKLGAGKMDFPDIWLREAKLRLLARLDPSSAFSDVIVRSDYVSENEEKMLSARLNLVAEPILLKGVENSLENVRLLSLKELARRRRIPDVLAATLVNDASVTVRAIALEAMAFSGKLPPFQEVRKLLSNGDVSASESARLAVVLAFSGKPPISPSADEIIVSFYLAQDTQRIVNDVDWFSVNGPLAYKALVLSRFDQISQQIRSDIGNGFRRIREESNERMKLELGSEFWEKREPAWRKYDESTRSDFTEAALIGLAANGQPSDAGIARPYLSHENSSLRDAAAAIICRFGGPEDVDALMKITKEAWGDARRSSATAALRLSQNPVETACELAKNSDEHVARIALRWLFRQNTNEVESIFKERLRSENADHRIQAIYYFSRRRTADQLIELLNSYTEEETYYYNVVTWLDRLLYSPPRMREVFALRLKQQANDTDAAVG